VAALIGYFAGVLTVLSFLPQVIRAWRTRQVRDLSVSTFVLLITSASVWCVYGLVTNDVPVVATNSCVVGLNCAILTAKLRYSKLG
jgi:MtN3 and saliva related transmembrane protein